MISKKQNGSALIIMLFVITLLLVLGTSLLEVYTSTYKTEITYDDMKKVDLLAESGADYGISKAITEKQCVSSMDLPDGTLNSSDANNNITCSVSFLAGSGTGTGTIFGTITSTAHDLNNKHSKTITVVLNNPTIPSDPTNPTGPTSPTTSDGNFLTDNCINVFGSGLKLGNGSGTTLTANGSLYLQGNSISEIGTNLNVSNGNLTVVDTSGELTLDNNSTSTSVDGSIFLQSSGDITLGQNITCGTLTEPSGLTVLSDKAVNFENNASTSNIYGDTYVNSASGFQMNQTLNINNGGLTVENGTGDIDFTNNSNNVNINSSVLLKSNSNIYLDKYFQVGNSSTKSNLIAEAGGSVDLGAASNQEKDVTNDFYVTSNNANNSILRYTQFSGISNKTVNKVSGAFSLKSNNDIMNDWGYYNQINGNYYAKSNGDITFNSNNNSYYNGSYTVISGGKLTDNTTHNNAQMYIKSNSISNSDSEPSMPTEPISPSLPNNISRIAKTYNIANVVNNSSYPEWNGNGNVPWDESCNDLAFIRVENTENAVIQAINSSVGNRYKLIIIDGSVNIAGSYNDFNNNNINISNTLNINNTVIYCTGQFSIGNNVSSPVNFVHSVLYSNGFQNQNTTTNMTAIDVAGQTLPFSSTTEKEINTFLSANLDSTYTEANLTDSGSAGSTSSGVTTGNTSTGTTSNTGSGTPIFSIGSYN